MVSNQILDDLIVEAIIDMDSAFDLCFDNIAAFSNYSDLNKHIPYINLIIESV
jgi:hypothetical protein